MQDQIANIENRLEELKSQLILMIDDDTSAPGGSGGRGRGGGDDGIPPRPHGR